MDTTIIAADGHRFSAYHAGSVEADRALIIVQEIFGVNHHMRHVADAFAKEGYYVIVPALFDRAERDIELGYTGDDIEKGLALRAAITEDKVLLDILAAAGQLPADIPRGIIGYCWGGTVAWTSATRSTAFKAAVGWYGGGIAAAKDEVPNCPTQLHFGETDGSIPMAAVESIKAARPEVEVFVYPGAGHGFGCEERGSYVSKDAELAQKRTLEFFAKHL
jgi:carboxymethylenebutenolidase